VLTPVTGTVASVKIGTHDGFIAINGELAAQDADGLIGLAGDAATPAMVRLKSLSGLKTELSQIPLTQHGPGYN